MFKTFLFASLLLLVLSFSTFAGTVTFTVTNIDGSINSSGIITTDTEYSPNVFGVTNITGTFTDTNNGINGAISDPFTQNDTTLTSPDGLYNYDQLLYLNGSPQLLDSTGGLLFMVDGTEVNIAGGGNGLYPYFLWETMPGMDNGAGNTSSYLPPNLTIGYAVDFEEQGTVPEPGTMSLFGAGLIGLGLLLRKNTVKTANYVKTQIVDYIKY